MNQKVLLLTGLGAFAVILYVFIVVNGRYAGNVHASVIFLLVYLTITSVVVVWKPNPPA